MNERKLNTNFSDGITRLKALIKEFPLTRNINKFIFKGKGLEFDGYRDYMPDEDDSSCIDWKASVRANKLLARKYIEEREIKTIFLVDAGSNMVFGSTEKLKCEYVAELVGALSKLLIDINDWVGFLLFSDKIRAYAPPRPGQDQFLLLLDELSKAVNYGGKSDLNFAIDYTVNYLSKGASSLIIISDFIYFDSSIERKISFLKGLFKDVIAIRIRDPLDKSLPFLEEEFVIESVDGKKQLLINPSVAKKSYEIISKENDVRVKKFFEKYGIDFLDLDTSVPFPVPLSIFLKQRMAKIL